MINNPWTVAVTCIFFAAVAACGGDDDDSAMPDAKALGAPNPDGAPGDSQTPPTTDGSAVEAWLKKGDYKKWTCETVEHSQMKVSRHTEEDVDGFFSVRI